MKITFKQIQDAYGKPLKPDTWYCIGISYSKGEELDISVNEK